MSGTANKGNSFEEQVNSVVEQATVDEKGNLQLPDGVEASEEVLYAAKLAKRHRDTQSAYTKAQQRAKQLEKENEELAANWEKDAIQNLSSKERARLEELKHQDPDAWHKELSELTDKQKETFSTRRQEIRTKVANETELERRTRLLEEYNEANPEHQITDEVIENDIPPRIVNKFKSGDLTFDEFLEQSAKYISTPKKVDEGVAPEEEPNFAKARGGSAPSEQAIGHQDAEDYSNTIF